MKHNFKKLRGWSKMSEKKEWLQGIEGDYLPELIESNKLKIRVISGPGSGKSTGLKRRVQRLIQEKNVDPDNIFIGTFTRAIADELHNTLEEHGLHVSTLHSLASYLLRNHSHVLGSRTFRFLLNFEKDIMLYDIMAITNNYSDYSIYDMRDLLKELMSSLSKRTEFSYVSFKGHIERWMNKHKCLLIEEVVPMVTEALEGNDIPQGEFDHVIVDEYQDLTACEQKMVELIWSGEGSLIVLGDDDQSIYGFRYNHPEGINGFEERHKNLHDINIPENWRSGKEIVNIANLMIAEGDSSKPQMQPKKGIDGNANLVYWASLEKEIGGLSKYIESRPDEEFLILVPRRFIGYRLKQAIGDEAVTKFTQEALQECFLQKKFVLANLIANPNDKPSLRSWLSFHYENIEKGTKCNSKAYNSIYNSSNNLNLDLVSKIAEGILDISGRGQKNIKRQSEQLLHILDQVPESVEEKIEFIFNIDKFDLDDYYDKEDKKEKIKNDINRLYKGAKEILETEEDYNFKKIIEKLQYKIATRTPLVEREDDVRVKIMTLHSAKGLEADQIILAGMADQIIPGLAEDIENIEEQRRLLYVAITRAKKNLIVSWPKKITLNDARSNNIRVDNDYLKYNGEVYTSLSKTNLLPRGLEPINGISLVE